MTHIRSFTRHLRDWRIWAHALFWSWNLIFVAFMAFGFAPLLLPELLRGVRDGVVPAQFFAYGVVIALIPILSLIIGFGWLRRDPARLFAFAYAVEGPLMLLLVVRFFVVRQVTPAIGLLLAIAALGLATLLWRLLDPQRDERPALLRGAGLLGMSLLLLVSLYAAAWILFYVVPVSVIFTEGVASVLREIATDIPAFLRDLRLSFSGLFESFYWFTFSVLGFILFVFTATLVVLMPIAVPVIVARAWRRSLRALTARRPLWQAGWQAGWQAVLLPAMAVAAFALVFVLANRQPQQRAFDLLAESPQNVDEASALLDQNEAIREGLLNAYLAPQRYVSAHGDVQHIRDIYQEAFDLEQRRAEGVQRVYEDFVSPLLYRPVRFEIPGDDLTDALDAQTAQATRFVSAVSQDALPAAQLYETFFDQDILDGERDDVVQAVRTTWDVGRATAAWQAIDDREVYLLRQEITISEEGDWAEVELYEVYQNQTTQREEVVYYFSLPESAAVTGVWLGNSAERSERFAYRVAPRGAAQAVYQSEVRRRVDPALVEQIGPQQYRLRVFPIEPRMWVRGGTTSDQFEEGPPLHMWLTYRVLAEQGERETMSGWPLPRLSDLRNVYWDDESTRLLHIERDGERVTEESLTGLLPTDIDAASSEAWLPSHIWVDAIAPRAHLVAFGDGQSVVAQPLVDAPALPDNLRLAVVLDRSRSMAVQEQAVTDALWQLTELAPQSDLFLTASPFRGEAPAVAVLGEYMNRSVDGELLYYGGQNAATLLAQFSRLARDADTLNDYDAILVLTDDSGYEVTPDGATLPLLDAPLWMIHLGGVFPPGYDDDTLEAIQASGGGAAADVQTALTRLAAGQITDGDVVDGYLWQVTDNASPAGDSVTEHGVGDPFAALAARRLILSETQRQRQTIGELETLDALHAIAIEQSIVTPYSSMIVLVEARQDKLLDELENNDDRFEREFEEVGETNQDALAVTGVPEPEEWLLIALAVGMLGWYVYSRRQSAAGVGG